MTQKILFALSCWKEWRAMTQKNLVCFVSLYTLMDGRYLLCFLQLMGGRWSETRKSSCFVSLDALIDKTYPLRFY